MLTSECPRSCRQSASCSLRWLDAKLDFIKSVLQSDLIRSILCPAQLTGRTGGETRLNTIRAIREILTQLGAVVHFLHQLVFG